MPILNKHLQRDPKFKKKLQENLMWECLKLIAIAFLHLEHAVAVELPLNAARDAWYPQLSMAERLWIPGWISNKKITKFRLFWGFLWLIRRLPGWLVMILAVS